MENRIVMGVTIDAATKEGKLYHYSGWVEFGMPYGGGRTGHASYIRCRINNNTIHETVRNVFAFAGCEESHAEQQLQKAISMANRFAASIVK